ncbi:restriction endonuclease [Mycobacterium antarcticum]|uniref:restriction endonuclease n=1 Tax=Mycolicibacterium sp. TUM20985 TaxID=3023370 RepID=UPI0025726D64|nr:restriction endonuclease [Mycolicibacterium sp. TUM20985]
MRLVWKAYVVVAVAAGVWAYVAGLGVPWSVAVAVLAPALPAFLVGVLRGARTPGAREDPAGAKQAMSGVEFEDHVARIAKSSGTSVIMTAVTGDFGVDLIVGRRPNRLAIQCKRQSRPVGAGAVQEVVAGAVMHDCAHTMVVTNHDFTPAARKLAERHGCVLVGGNDLTRLRSTIRRLVAPDPVR